MALPVCPDATAKKAAGATTHAASAADCIVKPACCWMQDASGSVVWSKDNKSIFYVTKDDLDRPHKAGFPSSTLCSGTSQRCT